MKPPPAYRETELSEMVSTMTDSSELQRMARLVDINRQHLEEINQQIESIEAVQLEHADAKRALEELAKGSSGHIPLGAGVMIPIPKEITTIVDLGTGIFGERKPEEAAKLVQKRLDDLTNLKSQFEADAAMITQRIEQLANSFEKAAKEMAEKPKTPETLDNNEKEAADEKPTKRRRKGFGGELTLDD